MKLIRKDNIIGVGVSPKQNHDNLRLCLCILNLPIFAASLVNTVVVLTISFGLILPLSLGAKEESKNKVTKQVFLHWKNNSNSK